MIELGEKTWRFPWRESAPLSLSFIIYRFIKLERPVGGQLLLELSSEENQYGFMKLEAEIIIKEANKQARKHNRKIKYRSRHYIIYVHTNKCHIHFIKY